MDSYIFQQINGLAGKFAWLDNLAVFFAEYLAYILITLAILILLKKKRKAILQIFLAAVLTRFGIVELIRFFWQRSRPYVENNINLLLEHRDTASFPSGHAAFFFAISFVVYSYNKKTGIGFFIASFLMGLSRIFVGVHWPSDILAGMAVGVFSGWLIMKFFKKEKVGEETRLQRFA